MKKKLRKKLKDNKIIFRPRREVQVGVEFTACARSSNRNHHQNFSIVSRSHSSMLKLFNYEIWYLLARRNSETSITRLATKSWIWNVSIWIFLVLRNFSISFASHENLKVFASSLKQNRHTGLASAYQLNTLLHSNQISHLNIFPHLARSGLRNMWSVFNFAHFIPHYTRDLMKMMCRLIYYFALSPD